MYQSILEKNEASNVHLYSIAMECINRRNDEQAAKFNIRQFLDARKYLQIWHIAYLQISASFQVQGQQDIPTDVWDEITTQRQILG